MKRKISILLALSILLTSCITPAFAENAITETNEVIEETTETEELQPNEQNSEETAPTEENSADEDETEKTTEEIIAELPVSEEYSAEQELPEEETTLSEDEKYMLNIVLFTLSENTELSAVKKDLKKLGLREITPVFTNEDGTPKAMGKKNEVWYRAYTSEDANEVTESLTEINGVTYAEPEYVYIAEHQPGEPTEGERHNNWEHDELLRHDTDFWWQTEFNHDYAPGKDTVVAVIDTGVDYTHEDLAANMWVNEAELNGTPGVDDDGNGIIDDIYGADMTATDAKGGNPMDDNGHGTHVAGIIGMSPNGVGGVGLAYGAKIMAVKAGQSTGTFSSSHIAKAINYAHMMGADVINMSFGGASKSYLVETALEDAFSDCVLVASAGNDGLPTTDAPTDKYPKSEDIYPAGYTYVLGVMATDKNGSLASFSNWDYNPNANCEYELTAPGVDIYSTLPNNRYAKWSGTSMAAPCVSAAAAIIRSHYSDTETYSSRFVMGQLVSATKSRTGIYPALNIFDSINYLPKPNITIKDTFLMDNKENDEANDGDSIIDAGETIDLGVLVRNQWGLTGDITVKADAISDGGVANPYIEFLTDAVTLQPAGTFQEVNNGFVYDDSLLTSISNPIRFKVSKDTPNDTEICINITITTTNGADERDSATYEETATKTFRVQAGRGIQGTLTEDTTLTSDYLWIIENSLLIPEGITLTIEPGTKVQFYSSDYEDAYGGKTIANINCDGTLNAIGTEDEPIEMYPGAGFEGLCVEIAGNGVETLKYCEVTNPKFGYQGNSYTKKPVNMIDHCKLIQNTRFTNHRYVSGNVVCEANWYRMCIENIINSKLFGIRYAGDKVTFNANNIENSLFSGCQIELETIGNEFNSSIEFVNGIEEKYIVEKINVKNSVFNGSASNLNGGVKIINPHITFDENVYTYDGATSKYIIMNEMKYMPTNNKFYGINYDIAKWYAEQLGGILLCIEDEEEMSFIENLMHDLLEQSRKTGNSDYIWKYVGIGYTKNSNKEFEWENGNNYQVSLNNTSHKYGAIYFNSTPENITSKWTTSLMNDNSTKFFLELPKDITVEEIKLRLENCNLKEYLSQSKYYAPKKINNAVLNPVLNTDPNTWSLFQSDASKKYYYGETLSNNYWGTENKTLINKMIIDADDYAGTYQDIIEDPILTLESPELENIYPFVTKVYMTDSEGNIVQNVSFGDTYSVHVCFNRDMDEDTQPSVTFGGEAPYTDYAVSGDFVSAREWVGSVKIPPVLTGGTMYWRTKGGVAEDDKWLECGEDVLRFSFNIGSTGALAMLLNADGGANKVELSWAQNDYETLAGYNLYRSKNETSGFKKLNLSVITDNSYTDTDVDPGITYYYYFKVVNTDGNEEENVSNTASAAPIDNIYPVLKHTPVTSTKAGTRITISATATDNIGVESVKLYYRKSGDTSFTEQKMTLSATANLYVATIPASVVKGEAVEYYVTTSDADGNITYSGTANIPNVIAINSEPYILSMTPTSDSISGGRTVTILGGNFTEDMTLKMGGKEISEKSFIDQGQINFVAPSMASGTYAVTLTTADGTVISTPSQFSYTDSASIAEIPTSMTMTSGVAYTIPLYITASGDIISLHAELDLPSSDFVSVEVKKADEDASFTLDYTYTNGVLKIGCIGSSNIKGEGALLNIIVTPRVTEDKQYELTLHDVAFNGVAAANTISGEVIIKSSYTFDALVKYFAGTNNFVKDVTISASGAKGVTGADGKATLTVALQKVTISAQRLAEANAVTAYDASLVLQNAIGKTTLTENQKKAADVDGNGVINEYDAALILQKAVRKIDAFPTSASWIFVPASIDKTLSASSANSVSFTAISLGDVDGSFKEDAE